MNIPERFLIIDDDPLNNRLCRIVLEKIFENPDVVAFTEPETAMVYIEYEYLNNPVATVLFLDINMPVLTGWDVLDKLKNLCGMLSDHFTIFILSSSIDPVDKQKANENPLVSGYMEKPLKRERLQEMFNPDL